MRPRRPAAPRFGRLPVLDPDETLIQRGRATRLPSGSDAANLSARRKAGVRVHAAEPLSRALSPNPAARAA